MNFNHSDVPIFYHNNALLQQKIAADLLYFCLQNGVIYDDCDIKSILDVGCGTGFTTKVFANHFSDSKITGIDISLPMIDFANSITTKECVYNNIDFANYTYYEVQKHYDLIVSNFSMQWFCDLDEFFDIIAQKTNFFTFAIPINSSFVEIKNFCFYNDIKNPFLSLPSFENLYNILNRYKKFNYYSCVYSQKFDNLSSLLKHLNKIGAGGDSISFLDIKKLLSFFKGRVVDLSYDVVFGFVEL